MIFSCDEYGSIRRKAFNGINEVDKMKFQTGNKIAKLKLFFEEFSLKALNIFG